MLRLALAVLAVVLALSASSSPALAHERREVGKYTFVVGWSEEPALEGLLNPVFLRVTETATGRGVEGLDQTLRVSVTFGAFPQRHGPPLRAMRGTPGTYTAPMIPTRAGDYTFRFEGNVEDLTVDERFESGPQRFDPIRAPQDLQYPDRPGSAAALARELRSLEERFGLWRFAVIGAGSLALTSLALTLAVLARMRR